MTYILFILLLLALIFPCWKVVFANRDKINILIWIVDLLSVTYLMRNFSVSEFANVEDLTFYIINAFLGFLAILIFSFLLKDLVYYFLNKQNRDKRKIKSVLIYFFVAIAMIYLYFAVTYRIRYYTPVVDNLVITNDN